MRIAISPPSVAVLLALAACGGPAQLYEGPPRDRSEIAVLRRSSGADLRVLRIDEASPGGFEWHLAPGPHRIWVELQQYGTAMNVSFKAWSYCSLEFEAEPGRAYLILSENDQRPAGVDAEVTLGVRIVDAAGELVAAPNCIDKRPRFES